jgi:hypothetical protein
VDEQTGPAEPELFGANGVSRCYNYLSCALHLDSKAELNFTFSVQEKISLGAVESVLCHWQESNAEHTHTMPAGNLLLDVVFPKGHGP